MARIESSNTLVGKSVTRVDGTVDKIVGLLTGGYKMQHGTKLSTRNLTKVKGKFVEIAKTDIRQLEPQEGYVIVKPAGAPASAPTSHVSPKHDTAPASTGRVPRAPVKAELVDLTEIDEGVVSQVIAIAKTEIAKALAVVFVNPVDVACSAEFSEDAIALKMGLSFTLSEVEQEEPASRTVHADIEPKYQRYVTKVPASLKKAKGFEEIEAGLIVIELKGEAEFLFLGVDADKKAVLVNMENGKLRRVELAKFIEQYELAWVIDSSATEVPEEEVEEEVEEEDADESGNDDEDDEDNDGEEDVAYGNIDAAVCKRLELKTSALAAIADDIAEMFTVPASVVVPGLLFAEDEDEQNTWILHGVDADGKIILKSEGSAAGKGVRKTNLKNLEDKYSLVAVDDTSEDDEQMTAGHIDFTDDDNESGEGESEYEDMSDDELRDAVVSAGQAKPSVAAKMSRDEMLELLTEAE